MNNMDLQFQEMQYNEKAMCAALAADSFLDYECFSDFNHRTYWLKDKNLGSGSLTLNLE